MIILCAKFLFAYGRRHTECLHELRYISFVTRAMPDLTTGLIPTNPARDEEERDAVKWQEEVDAVKAFREQVTGREEKQATAFNAGAGAQGEYRVDSIYDLVTISSPDPQKRFGGFSKSGSTKPSLNPQGNGDKYIYTSVPSKTSSYSSDAAIRHSY